MYWLTQGLGLLIGSIVRIEVGPALSVWQAHGPSPLHYHPPVADDGRRSPRFRIEKTDMNHTEKPPQSDMQAYMNT
jgi:hypothetical protein